MAKEELRRKVSGTIFMVLGTAVFLVGGWFLNIRPAIQVANGIIPAWECAILQLVGVEVLFTSAFAAYIGTVFVFDKDETEQ